MGENSEQIAYCGLFCEDCVIRTREPHRPARELLATIKTPEFEKVARGLPVIAPEPFNPLVDHAGLVRTLEAIALLNCPKVCKRGGGSPDCPVKACCQDQGLDGCWACDEYAGCQALSFLNPVHQGANLENLKVIRERGLEEFLRGEKLW